MNEFLAEMYNTRETIGASSSTGDIDKLAEAQLLDEALQNEGIDINTLSGDQIVKVAHTLFGDESALVKAATEEEGPGEDETQEHEEAEGEVDADGNPKKKEAMAEKIAEADFLGRTMAHAFVNEQAQIEKDAGKAGEIAGKAWSAVSKANLGDAVKGVSGKAKAMKKSWQEGGHALNFAKPDAAGLVHAPTTRTGKVIERLRSVGGSVGRVAKEHKKTVAGGGLVLAGGTGGTAYALKDKKKAASALDVLAEQRALEILKEAGVGQQSEEEKLATAVEQRAWEMLQENGYTE